jgi:hypothetical protein
MIVTCVKWGTRYGDEWVLRLRSMVRKNLSIEHRFVCLTDRPVNGVECLPLEPGLPTWWSKISLFKPGQFDDDVLYFDLDVVIRSNIDRIVDLARTDRGRLWIRDDFSYSLKSPRTGLDASLRRLLGGNGCCNSSVMAWHGDAARDVWDRFTPEFMQELHGDQNHISRVMYPDKIGFLPDDTVQSFKYHTQRGAEPAPITVFHGNPKMDQLPPCDELRQIWEAA